MIALMAAMALTLAPAPAPVFDDNMTSYPGGWRVLKNEDNCALMRLYGDFAAGRVLTLRIAYYPKRDATHVALIRSTRTGLENRVAYPVSFRLVASDGTGQVWSTGAVTGMVLPSPGGQGYATFVAGKDRLDDLPRNARLELVDGNKVLESAAIDQIEAPLKGMAQCAASLDDKSLL